MIQRDGDNVAQVVGVKLHIWLRVLVDVTMWSNLPAGEQKDKSEKRESQKKKKGKNKRNVPEVRLSNQRTNVRNGNI